MSNLKEEQYYRKSFFYKDFILTEVKYYTYKGTSEERSFELSKITAEELQKYRKAHISGFVLKIDDNLYFTEIPKDMKLLSAPIEGLSLKDHLCGSLRLLCNRFSPNKCIKVRYGRCIEAFPFITMGYETFGTNADAFVVLKCKFFKI